jgi:hypothetical protein
MSYEDIDVDKIKVLLPTITFDTIDIKKIFPKDYPLPVINVFLEIDTMLCGIYDPIYDEIYNKLLNFYEITAPNNNFFTKYIEFMPVTYKYLKNYNESIDRAFRSEYIFERFSENININIDWNVPMFIKNTDGEATIKNAYMNLLQIDGIVLKKGDRLNITNQDNDIKNGKYIVVNIEDKKGYVKLISHTIILDNEWKYGDRIVTGGDIIFTATPLTKDIDIPKSGDMIWKVSTNEIGTVIDSDTNDMTIRIEKSSITDMNLGLCFEQPWIRTKTECESSTFFNKYKGKSVWDSPCRTNTDCPFFQSNKNYNNYRGECKNGYCSFPIGIKPIAYTKYELSGFPYCHGCKKEFTVNCCDDQKEYPNLKSPDYAFPLDQVERLAGNIL